MIVVHTIVFAIGVSLVVFTLLSAIRSFALPRSAPDPITRFVFVVARRVFDLRLGLARTYEQQDRAWPDFAGFQPRLRLCSLGVPFQPSISGHSPKPETGDR